MPATGFNYRILVVDDDKSILQTSVLVLEHKGYEVRAAQDGFAALAELRRSLPDVIISDLGMPNMSGFELLSIVRRRFPHIPVIAISGDYDGSPWVIADAFFSKADYSVEELFTKIVALLEQSPLRPYISKPERAPVWIPRTDAGYFVVACTECLRSFSIPDDHPATELRETRCFFCDAPVRYFSGFTGDSQKDEARLRQRDGWVPIRGASRTADLVTPPRVRHPLTPQRRRFRELSPLSIAFVPALFACGNLRYFQITPRPRSQSSFPRATVSMALVECGVRVCRTLRSSRRDR